MSAARERLRPLVARLAGRRVMVIGDLVLDRYLLTAPARLSREAPVMITRYEGEEFIPGGAANAVNNLLALGALPFPVGLVGRDAHGESLSSAFLERGVEVAGIVADDAWRTISKTRVMCGDPHRMKQQVLRIDREPAGAPSERSRSRVLEVIRTRLPEMDAVLLSDYGYGLVTGAVLDTVRGAAGDRVLTADSRYLIGSFRGVSLATPNESEAAEAAGFPFRTIADLDRGGRLLLDRIAAAALLVTRGNHGMSLFESGRPRLDIPASGTGQVTDVSGAGDTVIAVATLALASGSAMEDAARLANLAAGIVVTKLGAATCSPDELLAAVEACG